jgi:signal transduction histidine kinase
MDQFAGISLKTRLYVLVLAALIPVTILIVYVAEEQKKTEKDAILHKTKLLAQAAAETESLQVEATRDLMLAIVEAYPLADGQPGRLSNLLAGLHGHASGYVVFGILDPEGRLLAGSDPSGMERDYGGREWLTASLNQDHLTMGAYHGEHINGSPVLYFAQPIFNDKRNIEAVAFTALDLNQMNRSLFEQLAELPSGSRLTLVDEDQVLLRYEVDTGRWSIAQAFDPKMRQMVDQVSGVLVAPDETGLPRIYAYAQLKSAFQPRRISVVLEIPRSVALAASRRIFVRNLALLAVSAIMAVLSIWWAADVFILRRVGAMVGVSRRLAAGDLRARIGKIGVNDELSHLAGVFDEMADSLQVRMEREAQVMTSLRRSREQLRRLAAYQNDVREQERIRIAREIHDQLGQSLTILKMDLAWLRKHMPPGDHTVDKKMEAMARFIGEAMDTLHAVTAELRPVILDDFGLAAAIEWQVDAFRQRSGIGCRWENNGYEPDLPPDQATAIFRIFQELLTNIIRHAQADEVVVRLEKRDNEMMLLVADNGRGITDDEINSPHAFGLLGIRERLNPLGGRVTFEGRPGEGTRVTVHLPLTQKGGTS